MKHRFLALAFAVDILLACGAVFLVHRYLHRSILTALPVAGGFVGVGLGLLLNRFRAWRLDVYGKEIEQRLGTACKHAAL